MKRSLAASARSIDVDVGEFGAMGEPKYRWGLVLPFLNVAAAGKKTKAANPNPILGFVDFI